jgi:hypothetical protein
MQFNWTAFSNGNANILVANRFFYSGVTNASHIRPGKCFVLSAASAGQGVLRYD